MYNRTSNIRPKKLLISTLLWFSIAFMAAFFWNMRIYMLDTPYRESSLVYQTLYSLYAAKAVNEITVSDLSKKMGTSNIRLSIRGKIDENKLISYGKENIPLTTARSEGITIKLWDGKGTLYVDVYKKKLN